MNSIINTYMDINKCYVELYEILMHFSQDYLSKLPTDLLDKIKKNRDSSYSWKYDSSKRLEEQNMNRKTAILLSYINTTYWLDDRQKDIMNNFYAQNEIKVDELKRHKYDPNKIFSDNQNSKTEVKTNTELVPIESIKWYRKFINFINNLFKKR